MSYRVYKAQYRLGLQDSDFNYIRYHTVIFVQTNADGSGHIHHVTGDLVLGYRYETKIARAFEDSETFHASQYLGQINAASYPAAIDSVLQSQPPPCKQKVFSPSVMAYVRCKPDGQLYGPGEYVPPLEKCTEWTERNAVPALFQHRVVS